MAAPAQLPAPPILIGNSTAAIKRMLKMQVHAGSVVAPAYF